MNDEIRDAVSMLLAKSIWACSHVRPSWSEVEAIAASFHGRMRERGLSIVMLDCSKDEPAGDPSRLGLGPDAHWPWVDKP